MVFSRRRLATLATTSLAILVLQINAFLSTSRVGIASKSWSLQPFIHQTRTAPLRVVFTRLADDCIQALQTAEMEASHLTQTEVDNAFLLLGVCHRPGKTRSTLEKFSIEYKEILRALKYLQPRNKRIPRLSDFNDNKDAVSLPLSKSLQATLYEAGKIAEAMGSPSIQSEHVFLALLQYKELESGETVAATRDGDCEAMELIWHVDATLEGDEICEFLLEQLLEDRNRPQIARADGPVMMKKTKVSWKPEEVVRDNLGKAGRSPDDIVAAPYESAGAIDKEGKEETFLGRCGKDMTKQAKDGDLDAVHGRDEELQNCLRILARRRKNNVCLIGEAGVGKTAIAEGLAQLLISDMCPVILKGHRMITLEVAALLAGTKFRGEFEERFRSVIEELTEEDAQPTILFLDEIHTLIGAGSTEGGGMDAANLLKPYLARGQLQLIGATTISEYNKFISKDPALERRLQPVLIKEPSVEKTVGILRALLPFYTQHHRVEFTDDSLEAAAKLSDRYINDRFLPDKAIDVLDEAGALATLRRIPNEPPPIVDEALITSVISEWSNIPVGKLQMDEMSRLKVLDENIGRRVKGQRRAVQSVVKAIRRARTGVRNPRRPIASFLFCGPTGTGKTELCKALAETYFGSERDLIRIDCSEYMERYAVSRLTGPPPGYAGYEEGGQLTEAVRRAPHAVVLFDEMEKAHTDVLNLLLQVMEDGILTDGKGRTVSFKNTILIMTSNLGSKRVLDLATESAINTRDPDAKQQAASTGGVVDTEKQLYSKLSKAVNRELESTLRPEFLNRIDDIVVFHPLSEQDLEMIATSMILEIAARTKYERNVDTIVSGRLLMQIVKEGSKASSQFGARPLRRAVQRILEDAISESVVQGFLSDGDVATFEYKSSEDPSVPFYVLVSRARDDEVIQIEMEESSRDDLSSEKDEDHNQDEESSEDDLIPSANGSSDTTEDTRSALSS